MLGGSHHKLALGSGDRVTVSDNLFVPLLGTHQ